MPCDPGLFGSISRGVEDKLVGGCWEFRFGNAMVGSVAEVFLAHGAAVPTKAFSVATDGEAHGALVPLC